MCVCIYIYIDRSYIHMYHIYQYVETTCFVAVYIVAFNE